MSDYIALCVPIPSGSNCSLYRVRLYCSLCAYTFRFELQSVSCPTILLSVCLYLQVRTAVCIVSDYIALCVPIPSGSNCSLYRVRLYCSLCAYTFRFELQSVSCPTILLSVCLYLQVRTAVCIVSDYIALCVPIPLGSNCSLYRVRLYCSLCAYTFRFEL